VGDDPRGGLEDPGAEAAVEALDQGDPPTLRVGGDERDGVAGDVGQPEEAPLDGSRSWVAVEASAHDVAEGRDVPVVQEGRHVDRHRLRVSEMAVTIG
jgi:hypothetical protein